MNIIKFTYQPPISGDFEVFLVGDFNNWNDKSHPMKEEGGVYRLDISLEPGRYHYYFLCNDKLILDPDTATEILDNKLYSVIEVLAEEDFIFLVPFKIPNNNQFSEVSIVGDFNGWLPNVNKLIAENKYLKTCLFLDKGQYQYKFLANGDRWFNQSEIDRNKIIKVNKKLSPNSVIKTRINDYLSINKLLLKSISTNKLVFKNDIIKFYRYSNNLFECMVIIPNFPQANITLYLNSKAYKMNFIASSNYNTSYHQIIEIQEPDKLYNLQLQIKLNDILLYANFKEMSNQQNLTSLFVPNAFDIFHLDLTLSKRIIYQIMPDRFANGNLAINPNFEEEYYLSSSIEPEKASMEKNQEYYHLAKWEDIDILRKNPYSANNDPDWFAFYGGDLKGIKDKIPYLKDLGISLIYLNPIFRSKSPHRYDTIDFREIDHHLGDKKLFRDLISDLHKNNIKVILDIALNHCGIDFFAFKDCLENGNKSDYWTWFDWYKWPLPNKIDANFSAEDYYQCWWGVKDLPEFNYDLARGPKDENKIADIELAQVNVPLVNYLLESMKMWIDEYDIDGFRLDVPEEVPFWFWQLFRASLKRIKEDIYLVGEIWNDPKDWLQGKYFDGIMNYHNFKDPAIDYFLTNKISLHDFINKLSQGLIHLPWSASKIQMNLLGSHDTIRLRSLANDNLDKVHLTLIFQFTYVGIPHIYYGDEIFLAGNKDPDNRRPFPWDYAKDSTSIDLLNFYKTLINMRKSYQLLSEGYLNFIGHDKLLIYKRLNPKVSDEIIIIINNSGKSLDISQFISRYPKAILKSMTGNIINQYGYYIGESK